MQSNTFWHHYVIIVGPSSDHDQVSFMSFQIQFGSCLVWFFKLAWDDCVASVIVGWLIIGGGALCVSPPLSVTIVTVMERVIEQYKQRPELEMSFEEFVETRKKKK